MRKLVAGAFVASLLALPLVAAAQPEGQGTMDNEGFRGEPPRHAECSATDASEHGDEECLEFWENHLNWWSMDYKKVPGQALDHRHMPPPLGFALINFVIFLGIMSRLAWKPLKEYVATRHKTIIKDLADAAEIKKAAEAKLREYEQRMAGLDAEVDRIVSDIRAQAEAEKVRMQQAAEAEAKRIEKDAQAQMASEIARLERELRREIVDAAMAVAETLLTQKVTADDQRKLVDRYVGALESGAPAQGARS